MSIKFMTAVWELPNLTQSETLVLLALADYAGDNGECWPAIASIAQKARLGRRATQYVIQKLEQSGLVQVDRCEAPAGKPNKYLLIVEGANLNAKGAGNAREGASSARGGAGNARGGVQQSLHGGGAIAIAPEPSYNHQEEEKKENSRLNGARVPSRHIDLIFQHWQQTLNHPQSRCDEKRRRLIANAIRDYGYESVRECISGYALSPFHCGQNDRGTRYDAIEHILKDSKRIEAGIEFFAHPPKDVTRGTNGQNGKQSRYEQSNEKLRQWAAERGIDPAEI